MKQFSSLRWKLTALIAVGSLVAALVAAGSFSVWDLNRFWVRTTAELSALSTIVSEQVAPAVMLNDRRAAEEILAALAHDGRVRYAVLYDTGGSCFARHERRGSPPCPPVLPDGVHRRRDLLAVAKPVEVRGERQGTLVLAADLPSRRVVLRGYLSATSLILALSLLVAGAMALAVQWRVVTPILAIAAAARRMAVSRRFDQRVPVTSADEIGVLASSFNTMLDEIGRRDSDLAAQRQQLEREVVERGKVNAQLTEAKQKAEVAAHVKSEFLANMSHEIRTPLNGVLGMIGLVLESCTDAHLREQLTIAQSAAESLNGVLNEILDLSKIEAGKMQIERIGFDLHRSARECMQIFQFAAGQKHVRLELALAGDCPAWVQGDPVRLRQVLLNLLGNALKFTLQGEVRGMFRAGTVRCEVSDTGIGIPPEKLASIFEPFTQADGSHTRRFGGSGLGLTITRRLVDLMGGTLEVDSQVGRGSRFVVELPMEPCPEELRPAAPASLPDLAALPRLHILVAEDNAVNQKVLVGMLERQGWTVALAENGAQAYARFLEQSFDLILMDVQMPEMDGLEATDRIRGEERRRGVRSTPIVAFTAHASESQHQECLARGMNAVVTKPVSRAGLLAAIATVMLPAVQARG